jgi:hypothetical protein
MTLHLRGKEKQKIQEEIENLQKRKAELFDKSDDKPTAMQKTGTGDLFESGLTFQRLSISGLRARTTSQS